MKKFLILALLVASASCLTSDEYDNIFLEIFKDIRTQPSTASTIVRLSKYKQVFITFFQKYFQRRYYTVFWRSPIKGVRPSPYTTGGPFSQAGIIISLALFVLRESISVSQVASGTQAHGSTHCGPTSTLSTWPSERRLIFFMIFVGVHEFSISICWCQGSNP